METLSKQETLNINGGFLLTPLLTTKVVTSIVKSMLKLRLR